MARLDQHKDTINIKAQYQCKKPILKIKNGRLRYITDCAKRDLLLIYNKRKLTEGLIDIKKTFSTLPDISKRKYLHIHENKIDSRPFLQLLQKG